MYLSKVEMTGFKSFADKTVIEFDQGMTAVVGPNGSGKSNLSEAIRWVLGEQSAKSLRGNRMEDVIFNGTQDRKAVNIAKVSLILNNEDRYLDYDYSEIAITRSYNRNGDSKYTINNETVRLKDIVDLLLDSGLGKNSFSIISQGQVEQIFLNKPEERRTIFEEAAGVQKYQYRKSEAERKLIKSQDHLSRVKDIIHELAQQRGPLKDQKETAELYLERTTLLKGMEISLYTHQIERAKDEWQRREGDLKSLNQKIDHLKDHLEDLKTKNETDKNHQEHLVEVIESRQKEYYENRQEKGSLEGQLSLVEEKRDHLQARLNEKESNFKNLLASNRDQVDRRDHLSQEISQKQIDLESIRSDLKDLLANLNLVSQDQDHQIEALRDHLVDAYQKEASAKNAINSLEQSLEDLALKSKGYEESHRQLEENFSKSKEDLDEIENILAKQEQAKEDLEQELVRLKVQAKESQGHRLAIGQARDQILSQLQNSETKLKHLEQMQAQYVGFYAGVRAVMQAEDYLTGIHGTISDLIQVERDYQVAIDKALGGSLQHVVVDDDQSARQAVNYLKKKRAGRATFLPLTNIKGKFIPANQVATFESAQGYLGIAKDLVSYDTPYQSVIENLLGRTLVVDNLLNGQALSKMIKHRFKIVTLEGEILQAGGAVTGGKSKNKESSVLEREGLLTKARTEFQELQASYQEKHYAFIQVKEQVDELESRYHGRRQDLQELNLDLQEHQLRQKQAKRSYQTLMDQISIGQDDQDQAEKLRGNYQKDLEIAEKKLASSQTEIQDIQKKLDQVNFSQEERQGEMARLNQAISDLRTQEALRDYDLKQMQKNYRESTAALSSFKEAEARFYDEKESLQKQIDNHEIQLRTIQKNLLNYDTIEENYPSQIQALQEERQELGQILKAAESELQEGQQNIQGLYKKQARLEAQIESLQDQIDKRLLYLNQEYQLSFESALEQSQVIEDVKDLEGQVKDLKGAIQALGPVNLAAIDDFAILDDRYQALVEQESDLLTAMDQLQTTMKEMDHEVIQRFGQSFKQINQQFQLTFKRLFSGGQAQLELTDPDDLLTTGVDIIAQPPGKKKQHLALLSGGERALTAIALLFAILEVKPVPFVILDEVEAALDEANVFRYGEYIQDFTDQTQFIVITHRKGTMEHADVLYGVTMEQSGVSKLASVKLKEALNEIENKGGDKHD